MKLHQAVNEYELNALWDALATELSKNGDRERVRTWLRSNVNHYLEQQLPHMHDPRIKAPHYDIGLKWSMLLTPRDHVLMPPNNMSRIEVLDLFAHPELVEAYNNGCLLYRWHVAAADTDEVRQRLQHLVEALQAVHGKKKHWSSITVPAAVKIAEEWVAELNRKRLESGGRTHVVWNQQIAVDRPTPPLDHNNPLAKSTIRDVQKQVVQFHLLEDEIAYQSEGQVMKHCVASYWSPERTSRQIFSMRNATTGERLVTIEVNNGTVVQARGRQNASPTQAEQHLLTRFYEQMGFTEYKLTVADARHGLGLAGRHVGIAMPQALRMPDFPITVGDGGPRLFHGINNMQVNHDHYGRDATLTIEGHATAEGIAALQRLMQG